jgi:hypothetical protein
LKIGGGELGARQIVLLQDNLSLVSACPEGDALIIGLVGIAALNQRARE